MTKGNFSSSGRTSRTLSFVWLYGEEFYSIYLTGTYITLLLVTVTYFFLCSSQITGLVMYSSCLVDQLWRAFWFSIWKHKLCYTICLFWWVFVWLCLGWFHNIRIQVGNDESCWTNQNKREFHNQFRLANYIFCNWRDKTYIYILGEFRAYNSCIT